MKSLFERFLKKEPAFSYTIAEYMPVKTNRVPTDIEMTEYPIESPIETDEMAIDKIYQNS